MLKLESGKICMFGGVCQDAIFEENSRLYMIDFKLRENFYNPTKKNRQKFNWAC